MSGTKYRNKIRNLLIIILLIIVVFSGILVFESLVNYGNVDATSIIVDCNGTGDYTTIQEAIDNAISGDTIYVWSGMYKENVFVDKAITIVGNGSMNTVLDGNNTGDGFNITVDMVNITGFSIQNCSSNFGGILLDNVSFCNISNNNCSNNKNGIYLKNSHRNLISNNIFSDNDKNGVSVIESLRNELTSNSFSKNVAGIYLNGYWKHEPTHNLS
jgi:parallel beta-helix repeat protein